MEGNDLDNAIPPRIFVVYEGVLAASEVRDRRRLLDRRARSEVYGRPLDPRISSELWRLHTRAALRVEVVTFLPYESAGFLEERLEKEYLPVATVRVYDSRQALVAELPYLHGVIGIYDVPEHAGKYGGLGQTSADLMRLAR